MGFLYCLKILKSLPDQVLLSNQHVEPLFAFSSQQLDYMSNVLIERKELLTRLIEMLKEDFGIDHTTIQLEEGEYPKSPSEH